MSLPVLALLLSAMPSRPTALRPRPTRVSRDRIGHLERSGAWPLRDLEAPEARVLRTLAGALERAPAAPSVRQVARSAFRLAMSLARPRAARPCTMFDRWEILVGPHRFFASSLVARRGIDLQPVALPADGALDRKQNKCSGAPDRCWTRDYNLQHADRGPR